MEFNPLGFIEMFVVLAFAAGWGILELVCLRLDKRRAEESKHAADRANPPA